ncbi:MAG: hemolysin III family protein [Verrucomicrobia bacterium]|nr:hemolysin III family protein [Verrucomicrobiota bacterium]
MEKGLGYEIANSVIHGIAALLSVAGLIVLVVCAALRGTPWHVVSVSIYGTTMVLLFTASTLYHAFSSTRAQHVLHIIDHSCIFLLIAGTYTPFLLGPMRGPWGWSLFGVVWGLAAAGIALKIFFTGRFNILSTIIYVAMGWICLVAIKPMMATVSTTGLLWLLAGGLAYTFGVIFYLWRRIPWHHAIWHLFVFAGSLCHFFSILFHVIPGS